MAMLVITRPGISSQSAFLSGSRSVRLPPWHLKAGQAQVEFRVTPTRLSDPQGLEIDVPSGKLT
jgi:hypothetical protein